MKPETPAELAADLMFLFNQATYALATDMSAGLAHLGVTTRDYCVLLTAQSGEFTQKQLGDLCSLDKTTMVVTVDGLERAGLAVRKPSSTDRRARIVQVTPKGREVVGEARAIVEEIYEQVLDELPARERPVFVDSLVRLVGAGGRLAEPSHTGPHIRRRGTRAVG
jgi:MarR family transcriptional regulator, transcriptional regulator for hemolysin